MLKIKGFTLSEVLIALLVLGIIVAASVPVIMRLAPNKNVAMIKKAYYITESIVSGLINDSYYYPDNSIHCQGSYSTGAFNSDTGGTCYYGFDDSSSVTVLNTNINTVSDDANDKFRCLFASKLNIKENLSYVCQNNGIGIVTTMDGMTWNFRAISSTGTAGTIQIDVDGQDNGVNAYSLSGNTGLCPEADIWGVNACNQDLTSRSKKNFDRIEIGVSRDGKVSISETQKDFADIISGKKKVISGDDD